MSDKLYRQFDEDAVTDIFGDIYCDHVDAMTSESLRSKSDIAMELAYRDHLLNEAQQQIEALKADNADANTLIRNANTIHEDFSNEIALKCCAIASLLGLDADSFDSDISQDEIIT